MKKLLVIPVLVGVLAFSLPVMASSPTAGSTLTKPAQTEDSTGFALTAEQSQEVATEAASILASGVVKTPAAAQAIATSLVRVNDAKVLTTKAISAEALAIYNSYSEEMKAKVREVAALRGISIEEVIGNFIKAANGSRTIAWNANTCLSAVDGKGGNVHVVLYKAADAITDSAKATAGKNFLAVTDFRLQGDKSFKSLDTAFNLEGVLAKEAIGAMQFYDGAWHDVAVAGTAKNVVGLHIEHVGPLMFYKK